MADVFISYARKNIRKMQRIKKDLEKKGIRTWTDEGLTAGTPDWKIAIEQEVKGAKCVIALMSPEAKKSRWVRREIGFAETHKVPIIPILMSGDEEESVPIDLINGHYIDIRSNYTEKISEVAATIFSYKGGFTRADWGSLTPKTTSSQIRPKTGLFSSQIMPQYDTLDNPQKAKRLEIEKYLEIFWTKQPTSKDYSVTIGQVKLIIGNIEIFYKTVIRRLIPLPVGIRAVIPSSMLNEFGEAGPRSKLLSRNWNLEPSGELSYTWESPHNYSSISEELISANRIMGLRLEDIQIKLDLSSFQK